MRRAVLLTALIIVLWAPAAEARPVCGPADAATLARSAVARVYASDGFVHGCHRARRGSRRLTARWRARGAWAAGRYAAVRHRRGTRERLVVFDLRRGRELSEASAGRFVRVRLDPAGILGYTAVRRTRAGQPRVGVAGVIGDEADLEVNPEGPEVGTDVLGMAGLAFAYRRGDSIALEEILGGYEVRRRLLVRLGDLRIEVPGRRFAGYELFARPVGRAPIALGQFVDSFQRAGDLLATSTNHSQRGAATAARTSPASTSARAPSGSSSRPKD